MPMDDFQPFFKDNFKWFSRQVLSLQSSATPAASTNGLCFDVQLLSHNLVCKPSSRSFSGMLTHLLSFIFFLDGWLRSSVKHKSSNLPFET